MAEFRTGPIIPNERNSADIPAMVRSELEKFSGDTSGIRTAEEQLALLKKYPHRYVGAFDESDRLVTFAKFNDWRRADQIAFQSLGQQIKYKLRTPQGDAQLFPERPVGIFALTPYEGLSRDDAVHTSELLLDHIIDASAGREIRMSRFVHNFSDDPSWWATNHRNFKRTGAFGHVAGVLQELAIRQPDDIESDAEAA